MKQTRYIDLTTDFGFKRIFGSEANKDLLIEFLNALFQGKKEIVDLHYNRNEHVGAGIDSGSAVFDLTCTGSNGERFIIEVQRTTHQNFKSRMLFYASKLIVDLAPRGQRKKWNYEIPEIYVIILMDGFPLPGQSNSEKVLHPIGLCNVETSEVFDKGLNFIYVELCNFVKQEGELKTSLDKWLYVVKNLSGLNKLPTFLKKPIFEKLFNIAEYANLNKEEREMYDVSLKQKWDRYAIEEYQRELLEKNLKEGFARGVEQGKVEGIKKGIEKGIEQGINQSRIEIALRLKSLNLSEDQIIEATGLSKEVVQTL